MWSWVQCRICQRAESKDTWQATVQLRQKVPHRRTFLYLEQLILTVRMMQSAPQPHWHDFVNFGFKPIENDSNINKLPKLH